MFYHTHVYTHLTIIPNPFLSLNLHIPITTFSPSTPHHTTSPLQHFSNIHQTRLSLPIHVHGTLCAWPPSLHAIFKPHILIFYTHLSSRMHDHLSCPFSLSTSSMPTAHCPFPHTHHVPIPLFIPPSCIPIIHSRQTHFFPTLAWPCMARLCLFLPMLTSIPVSSMPSCISPPFHA